MDSIVYHVFAQPSISPSRSPFKISFGCRLDESRMFALVRPACLNVHNIVTITLAKSKLHESKTWLCATKKKYCYNIWRFEIFLGHSRFWCPEWSCWFKAAARPADAYSRQGDASRSALPDQLASSLECKRSRRTRGEMLKDMGMSTSGRDKRVLVRGISRLIPSSNSTWNAFIT